MTTIRRATLSEADTDVIVHHRRAMFRDIALRDTGRADDAALDAMGARFRPWLARKLETGEYLGWLAVDEGECDAGEFNEGKVVAGAGLWLMDWPPNMLPGGHRRGHMLNVYTEPTHRRRGIARNVMQAALAWCTANRIETVVLHASDEGEPLYASLGFMPTNEMRLNLPQP